ncbi:MAG: hypothetical protein HC886_14580 [Leptolyngbyaceae cyanobacterium SM1_1_3]|nr:hypothetical protein [Leptolyngbyaceae cyanobacterium SM1_1_3]
MTAISSVTGSAASQIRAFSGQAQEQVSHQVTSISSQLGNTVGQANESESGMVSGVTSTLDQQLGQIESSFADGFNQYTGNLEAQVTSTEEQASEPRQNLPGNIETAQQRAEERAQNSWLENQWNDLVEMVSSPGFWAGLVVGLLVGVLIIATFGTGAVVLVAAGAIAGAVGALAATVVGNYAEGKRGAAVFDGALRNMIWGAFGGAVGAAALVFLGGVAAGLGLSAGAALGLLAGGASLVAGVVTVLDNVSQGRPWDQGLLGNMLLAGLLTWIGGKIAARRPGDAPESSTPRQPGDAPEPAPRQPGDTSEPTRSSRQPEPDAPEQQRLSGDEEPAGRMDTGASDGLESTPETIRDGSVRMEQHPTYQSTLTEIESLGFEVRRTSGSPHVSVREVLSPEGQVIRVERAVYLREGMRFLDLEHEVGHIRQLTERFGERTLPTERVIEYPDGRIKQARDQGGVLTNWQNAITEYHNRLIEFLRLHERGANSELLREHARGVREWRSEYRDRGLKGGRSPSRSQWADEHFPDLPQLESRYTDAGGVVLER